MHEFSGFLSSFVLHEIELEANRVFRTQGVRDRSRAGEGAVALDQTRLADRRSGCFETGGWYAP